MPVGWGCQIRQGKPQAVEPTVTVKKSGDSIVLDNGITAVRVPAAAGAGVPCPIAAVRLNGKWVGAGRWDTTTSPNAGATDEP